MSDAEDVLVYGSEPDQPTGEGRLLGGPTLRAARVLPDGGLRYEDEVPRGRFRPSRGTAGRAGPLYRRRDCLG